jgi:hypothetical protein
MSGSEATASLLALRRERHVVTDADKVQRTLTTLARIDLETAMTTSVPASTTVL